LSAGVREVSVPARCQAGISAEGAAAGFATRVGNQVTGETRHGRRLTVADSGNQVTGAASVPAKSGNQVAGTAAGLAVSGNQVLGDAVPGNQVPGEFAGSPDGAGATDVPGVPEVAGPEPSSATATVVAAAADDTTSTRAATVET
jgi:hypothetical protein